MSQLSTIELQQELERRINALKAQREELLEKIANIDQQLRGLGVDTRRKRRGASDEGEGEPGRPKSTTSAAETRRANERPLVEVLAGVLKDRSMSARDLAEAATQAGYVTKSKNFVNSVSVALYRDDRFKKIDGKWAMTEA